MLEAALLFVAAFFGGMLNAVAGGGTIASPGSAWKVAGLGDFIAAEAVRRLRLELIPLAERLGDAARTAPAAPRSWTCSPG